MKSLFKNDPISGDIQFAENVICPPIINEMLSRMQKKYGAKAIGNCRRAISMKCGFDITKDNRTFVIPTTK